MSARSMPVKRVDVEFYLRFEEVFEVNIGNLIFLEFTWLKAFRKILLTPVDLLYI